MLDGAWRTEHVQYQNVEGLEYQIHEILAANEDKAVTLDVYSTRDQEGRSKIVFVVYIKTFVEEWSLTYTTAIEMVATKKWGDGTGGLLGCSIRFCMFDAANDVVWHILVSRARIELCVVHLLFIDANVALNVINFRIGCCSWITSRDSWTLRAL